MEPQVTSAYTVARDRPEYLRERARADVLCISLELQGEPTRAKLVPRVLEQSPRLPRQWDHLELLLGAQPVLQIACPRCDGLPELAFLRPLCGRDTTAPRFVQPTASFHERVYAVPRIPRITAICQNEKGCSNSLASYVVPTVEGNWFSPRHPLRRPARTPPAAPARSRPPVHRRQRALDGGRRHWGWSCSVHSGASTASREHCAWRMHPPLPGLAIVAAKAFSRRPRRRCRSAPASSARATMAASPSGLSSPPLTMPRRRTSDRGDQDYDLAPPSEPDQAGARGRVGQR